MSLSMSTFSLLFLMLFILSAILVFKSNRSPDSIIFAQFQNDTSSLSSTGVNITSPDRGQQIPVNISNLSISGKSTDKPSADDCQVFVIVNNVKPYQHATASGTTGEDNDFSNWFFTLNSSYTSIKEGANKITAKLSCLPNVVGNITTKWYSINVTGMATTETSNSTNILPLPSSPINNSTVQAESESLNPSISAEQELATINDKIREETNNLKDRIMEQVEEKLKENGIELNMLISKIL